MPRRKDIWRCAIAPTPLSDIISVGGITDPVLWLPEEPDFQFIADPFGWREGSYLHVFVEHYDYRTRHGTIHRIILDDAGQLVDRRPCLVEPWHLSYPQIFSGEGETWMLPEAHQSGNLTLYRDHGGLATWRAESALALDCVPVDASILQFEGRWWIFYSPATSKSTKISHLHGAWADSLCGPWTPHPGNPVRIDRASSRPGGTPVLINGRIMLPVQDCTKTYGGAVRPLWIDRLDEGHFVAEAGPPLNPPSSAGAYGEGMHTLTACGDITLFDAKYIDRSLRGLMVDFKRSLGGYVEG